MTGALCLMAGGGSAPTNFGGVLQKSVVSASACSVTATFGADGDIVGTEGGPAGTFTDTISADTWFAPVGGTPGNFYEIRGTVTSGDAPSSGTMVVDGATWNALSSSKTVVYNSGTGGPSSSRIGTVLFEVRPAGGGANVCSGSIDFSAQRDS